MRRSLRAFGSEFGNPPEPCDYDGTPLEVLVAGFLDGSIILDSLFMEYELEDVATYYVIGCPDPVTDTLIFANSMMLDYAYVTNSFWGSSGEDSYGNLVEFVIHFYQTQGTYRWTFNQYSIDIFGYSGDGFFGGTPFASSQPSPIPFPETWFLDEEGIHIESGWNGGDWPYYANYLHILPYWHYAE